MASILFVIETFFFPLFCLHQPYYNEKIFFFFFSFLCLFLFAGVDDVVVYSHIYTMMQYRRRQQQDFLCWEGEKNGRKKRARGAPPVVYYIVPDLFFSGSVVQRRCLFGISLSLTICYCCSAHIDRHDNRQPKLVSRNLSQIRKSDWIAIAFLFCCRLSIAKWKKKEKKICKNAV